MHRDLIETILTRWKKSGLCDPADVLILHAQSDIAKSRLGDLRVLAGRNLCECTEPISASQNFSVSAFIPHTSIHKAKGLDSKAVILIGMPPHNQLTKDYDHFSWFMAVSRARQLLAVVESTGPGTAIWIKKSARYPPCPRIGPTPAGKNETAEPPKRCNSHRHEPPHLLADPPPKAPWSTESPPPAGPGAGAPVHTIRACRLHGVPVIFRRSGKAWLLTPAVTPDQAIERLYDLHPGVTPVEEGAPH